jgi:hypothetical protein
MSRSFSLRRTRSLLLLSFLIGGCTDLVHVKLVRKDCDDEDISQRPSSSDGGVVTPILESVLVEIRRLDGVGVQRCLDLQRPLKGLDDLQGLLGQHVIFDELPTGGSWTLWVQGYTSSACAGDVRLCGRITQLSLPPPDGTISIDVVCVSELSSVEKQKALKECHK